MGDDAQDQAPADDEAEKATAAGTMAQVEECDCGGHITLTLYEGRTAHSQLLTTNEAMGIGQLLTTAAEVMQAKGAGAGKDRRH